MLFIVAIHFTSTKSVEMTPEKLYDFLIGLQSANRKNECDFNVKMLSPEDLLLPFVGREAAMDEVAMYFKKGMRAAEEDVYDRNQYPIPACAWIPGLGKTAMLHRGSEILDRVGVTGRQINIIVPYYNGLSLQWMDMEFSIECSFSWRLLFMVFLKGNGVNFEQLCASNMLPFNSRGLTLTVALNTVRLALLRDRKNPLGKDEKLSIFLGIDEFQKVDESGDTAHKKLTELCQKLHGNRFNNQITMFPMFAGTDWTLIRASGEDSGMPVKRIAMPPLDTEQAEQLYESVMGDTLFSSALASQHVLTVGSLPRSLLNYCRGVLQAMDSHGAKVPSADHLNAAYNNVITESEEVWNSPTLLAKLVALCFAVQAVTNHYEISYINANGVEEETRVDKLSNSGMCLINYIPGVVGSYVTVPYIVVHLFSNCVEKEMSTDAEKYLLRSVQWMVKNVDQTMYDKQPGQSFEDFCAAFTACRINALLVLGHNTVPVRELWRGGVNNVSEELQVKLLPVTVVRAEEQLSITTGDTVHELRNSSKKFKWRGSKDDPLHCGYVVRNGDSGIAVDSWVSLPLASDPSRDVMCAEQTKLLATTTISLGDIMKYCEAISSVVPTNRTTVVSCVRNSLLRLGSTVTPEQLPVNTVIVSRDQLHRHFGMFHSHPAVSPFVDVNSCGKERLSTLDLSTAWGGGGMKAAIDLVLQRRSQSEFVSKEDFLQFLSKEGISCNTFQQSRLVCRAGASKRPMQSRRGYSTLRPVAVAPSDTIRATALRPAASSLNSRLLAPRTSFGSDGSRILKALLKLL